MSKCYDNPDYDNSESDIQNTWNQPHKSKEERKKNFYCGDEVDYDDKCLEQCDGCVDATGVDYGYLPEEKPKYPIGGYAPGNYMCNCSTCKTQFQGDKRAVQCEPCAIKMVQKQNIIDMMKGDKELGLYDEIQPEQIWNEEKKKGIKQLIQDHKKETLEQIDQNNPVTRGSTALVYKQETTLEQAAELFFRKKDTKNCTLYKAAKLGAKWQQEQICNSEVLQRIRASKSDAEARRIIRTI